MGIVFLLIFILFIFAGGFDDHHREQIQAVLVIAGGILFLICAFLVSPMETMISLFIASPIILVIMIVTFDFPKTSKKQITITTDNKFKKQITYKIK